MQTEEIAYVGDRLDNDVLPARQAGPFAVFLIRGPWGFVHAQRPEASQANAKITGLKDLVAVLADRCKDRLVPSPRKICFQH